MQQKGQYSLGEEIANAVTHGVGALFGIAALTLLVVFSAFYGTVWHIVSFSVYGAALVIMYTMSTLYHALPGKEKKLFQIFDHSSIYLLIAGTYTPFALVPLRASYGWWLFGLVWMIAFVGIVLCTFPKANSNKLLSAAVYIAMGWLILFFLKPLRENVPKQTVVWLVTGGVFYTFGAIFYVLKRIPYHHAVWHMFVLFGSICHFIAVFYLLSS